ENRLARAFEKSDFYVVVVSMADFELKLPGDRLGISGILERRARKQRHRVTVIFDYELHGYKNLRACAIRFRSSALRARRSGGPSRASGSSSPAYPFTSSISSLSNISISRE